VHGTLASQERLTWLERQLGTEGSVTLFEAAEALGVSEMTIRRDLAELERRGAAKRIRGGARAIGPETFGERHSVNAAAKAKIAAKLAGLVPAAGAVGFDASSTVMRLSTMLTDVSDLTVITNGPDTFAALQGQPGVHPLITGGRLEARTGSLVGPLACHIARELSLVRFFASAAAIDPDTGASEATLDEAELKRHFAVTADEVVLAVDASKLGQRAMARSLAWDRIDVLVTELDPGDERLEPYRSLTHII
jgi:DeoR family transcriptional regulator, fructose operon transcriptional repressor